MTTIVFAGGGSGGHVFPGIAVAEELVGRNPKCRCLFVGSNRAIEAEMVKPYGFEHQGLSAPCSTAFYKTPFRAARSFWQAYRVAAAFLDQTNPRVVVGLGSSSSVPVVLAAARRKIPILLLEQNAVLGRANRLVLPLAHHLCLSYAQTAMPARYAAVAVHTGNPVRSEIASHVPRRSPSDQPCLLILGGSQGARAINEIALGALDRLVPQLSDWHVVHQTGAEELDAVKSAYASRGVSATVSPFLNEIGAIYSRTALAISRAGGTTLAELALHSIPAVLIPYPCAIRDHQTRNARQCEQAGGAVAVPQLGNPAAIVDRLCEILPALLADPKLRMMREKAMFSLACPDASERVADLVERYCSAVHMFSADGITKGDWARAS